MKTLNFKRLLFPIFFWGFLEVIFFITMINIEGYINALKYSLIILIPLIIPVHIHEYIFNKFILKGKYINYALITTANIALFGYTIKWLESLLNLEGYMANFVVILIFMFVYIGAKYIVISTRQRFLIKESEAQRSQAELELLKSQINPHFLFNSLNSIYSLILDKSDQSGEAVMLLSDLMRYIIESGEKEIVPIDEEIKFIDNYINLEKLRLGNAIKLNYQVIGEAKNLFIYPMILIAFVENVFKHGISSSKDKNEFKIQIKIENNELHFETENNIAIRSNNLEKKEVKTGIKNVKHRLELLYPNKYNLAIEDNNLKFQVKLDLKLNS